MPEGLETGLALTVVGLAIVFGVLGITATIVRLLGTVDRRWQEAERRREVEALERTPTIDNTTAVLISAAVATYLGGRFQIRSVRRLMRTDLPESPWSAQGRATLRGSHVISRRKGINR